MRISAALAACPIILLFTTSAFADPPPDSRKLIVKGKLAAVYVEPVLYRRPDVKKGFLVSIEIRNLSDRPIAIDGTGERWFIHPSQWGTSDAPARDTVDERTLVPLKLDDARKVEILRRMKAGTITVIGKGSTLRTLEMFDGSGQAEIASSKGKYFILSFDGQVFVSDGKDCEDLQAKAGGMTASDLSTTTPVKWKELPLPAAK